MGDFIASTRFLLDSYSVILAPLTASKIGLLIPVVKISRVGRPHNFSYE
jgi:hypothetical protein